MIWFFISCLPELAPTDMPPDFTFVDPEIRFIEWACDMDESTWSFYVETNGWTGNGHVWMSQNAEVTEKHILYSIGAERDGSADYLELNLSIVADWHDAKPSTSTRWRCSEQDELSFLVRVLHPEYATQSACRYWGNYIWESVPSGPECDTPLAE